MSTSASTADSSEVKGQKNCFDKCLRHEKVENYLDFFAIKVAPDVIPMDWWKIHRHQFPHIAQLARKWLCVTATSTPSKRVFSDCGLALTAKRSRNAGYLTITDDDIRDQFSKIK